MNNSIIINADDFGMSKGVNSAIQELLLEKNLNSTSLMTTGDFFDEALEFINQNKNTNFKIGLHLDLFIISTGFLSLFLQTLFKLDKKKFLRNIYKQIIQQIKKLHKYNIEISHIDGHRHVHMIPAIFHLVKKAAIKHKIPRIRVINENIFFTLKNYEDWSFFWNGGLIKYFLLRFFAFINNYQSDVYFFSILHSCCLDIKKLKNLKIPGKYKRLEIMLHPSISSLDKQNNSIEKNHLLSEYRSTEIEFARNISTCL